MRDLAAGHSAPSSFASSSASSSVSSRNVPDPRHIVTPDAFTVAPELLGRPLASPWRRAAAMAVDGLLIAFLSNAAGVLLAFAAGLVLFRISVRPSEGGHVRRSLRLATRSAGALFLVVAALLSGREAVLVLAAVGLVLFQIPFRASKGGRVRRSLQLASRPAGVLVLLVAALTALASAPNEESEDPDMVVDRSGTMLGETALASLSAVPAVTQAVTKLRDADSEEEAHAATRQVVSQLEDLGFGDDDIEKVLEGAASEADPSVRTGVQSAIEALETSAAARPAGTLPPDSLALDYVEAVSSGDAVAVSALRSELTRSLAADTLAQLSGRIDRLQAREEELEEELGGEREWRGWGILSSLRTIAEDFGLSAGWAALYFTAFLVLWRGRTPGKRIVGIRVIRLNGEAVTWWHSFERFGGYAAGLATGLLGYFQIFWDRNRQAVHDKISETVVIKG